MSTKRDRYIVSALIVLAGGGSSVFGAPVEAGGQPEASGVQVEHLPYANEIGSNARSYVYRKGWAELEKQLEGTTAKKVIDDPAVQAFLAEIRRLGERKDAYSTLYQFALESLLEEMVVTGVRGGEDGSGGFAAIVLPGGERVESYRKLHDAALGERYAKEAIEIEGNAFKRLGDGEDATIHTRWEEDAFHWATNRDAAAWMSKKPEQSLAESALFRETVGPLIEGQRRAPIALYYHHLQPAWDKLQGSEMGGAAWGQISCTSVEAAAGVTFIEGSGYRNRHYWKLGPERRGLFKNSEASRIDPEWLRRVPADTSGFTTGVWDPASFFPAMMAFFGYLMGADAEQVGPGAMGAMMFNPVMSQLGPRYLVYRRPGVYGHFPMGNALPTSNLVIASDLQNKAAFKETLEELPGGAMMMRGETQIGGHDVITFNVMYFSFYIALLDDVAIVTTNAQLLKDALDNWSKPGPSIVDTPAYKAADKYRLENACFELYMPPGGFSHGIYDYYVPMLQQTLGMFQAMSGMMGGPGGGGNAATRGIDPLLFPRGSDFAKHVTEATILSGRDQGDGVLFDGFAPVLCTPYYWSITYTLKRLGPGEIPMHMQMLQYLAMPAMVGN